MSGGKLCEFLSGTVGLPVSWLQPWALPLCHTVHTSYTFQPTLPVHVAYPTSMSRKMSGRMPSFSMASACEALRG